MFSGIVEDVGKIRQLKISSQGAVLEISSTKVLEGTKIGDSIAVNGTCLTVTSMSKDKFTVDMAPETLHRTNLGSLNMGSDVNLERSLEVGARIGGHFVQGHIDTTGVVEKIISQGNAKIIYFSAESSLLRYVVTKGYVTVDGMSLTVVDCQTNSFSVSFIPHTVANSVARNYRPGVKVNLEADIIGKYVEKLLKPKSKESKISADFLSEHGFLSS